MAFATFHERVVGLPDAIDVELAPNEVIVGVGVDVVVVVVVVVVGGSVVVVVGGVVDVDAPPESSERLAHIGFPSVLNHRTTQLLVHTFSV